MKKGVLLVNLGTPDSPEVSDVGKYLTEFLNDERVIDFPYLKRKLLVNGIIVPFRKKASAKSYQELWTKDGSPLLIYSEGLTQKVANLMGEDYSVKLAMRYQSPSINGVLSEFEKEGVSELIVLPLYPQYASSSTGSTIQKVLETVQKWENIPNVKSISSFFDHPKFIDCVVNRAKQFNLEEYDHVLFSYHGLPERHIKKSHDNGLPCDLKKCEVRFEPGMKYCYKAACYQTTRLLVEKLGLKEGRYSLAFQSRLGKDPWIQPYSDVVVEELAKKGCKKLLAFSAAFTADCLETIFEIGVEYQEIFEEHGGEKVTLVPSLNDGDDWAEAVVDIIKEA